MAITLDLGDVFLFLLAVLLVALVAVCVLLAILHFCSKKSKDADPEQHIMHRRDRVAPQRVRRASRQAATPPPPDPLHRAPPRGYVAPVPLHRQPAFPPYRAHIQVMNLDPIDP